ncbi:tyrosine-type recombinase/integrase [Novosphingobium sp.]|uniref:tyrosine-type recombinase/integrase n=1 Tax=Novosphingobium sp. TaxID=1874826 RepID=UPI003BADA5CD
MKLTDTILKRTKPQVRYRDFADEGTGITARIKSNGDVLFIWRGLREGVRTKVQIGTFPEMSVIEARSIAQAMKSDAKKAEFKPVPRASIVPELLRRTTVNDAFDRYMKVHAVNLASADNIRGIMEKRILPTYGKRDLKSITSRELNAHFEAMLDDYPGAGINKVLIFTKGFLNWCVAKDEIDFSPAAKIKPLRPTKARDRALEGRELGYLQLAIEEMGAYRDPLMLALHTVLRKDNLISLQWGQVVETGEGMEIRLADSKAGIPVIRWLTTSAQRCIPPRPENALDTDPVFAVRTCGSNTQNKLRKLTGKHAKTDKRAIDPFVIHDFRASAKTYLEYEQGHNRIKYSDNACEVFLQHKLRGVSNVHDNKYRYYQDCKELAIHWSAHLDDCLAVARAKSERDRPSVGKVEAS